MRVAQLFPGALLIRLAQVHRHGRDSLGVPVVFEQFLRKALERGVILALGGVDHPPRDQVGKHGQVVVAFAAVHLIDAQVRQLGEVQRGVGFGHRLEEQAPEPGVVFPENVAGLLHRHLAHQGQRKRLEVAGEVFAFAFPRQRHAPDVAAGAAPGTRWLAGNLGAFAKGIQVPPDPDLGVLVTDHLRMSAGGDGTFELGPEFGGLVNDQEEPFHGRRFIFGPGHFPAFVQPQQSFKGFFRYHRGPLSNIPPATGSSAEPAGVLAAKRKSAKPTVAIVEDDRDTARLWQRKFVNCGYEVVGNFAGAKAAWKALCKHPPDVIILDWELIPGPNGDWLLRQFAKHKLRTRIMVVTSHDRGEIQRQAFSLGAQGFLGKPVSLKELELRLQEMLQGKVPLSTHNGEFLRQQVCESPCAAWEKLSGQHQRIVAEASLGKGIKEICAVLGRSKGKVETQIQRIFKKLGTWDIRRVIALCAEAVRAHTWSPAMAETALSQAA
ncbi:MAG: DNA-binding response regulator [Proteobacteria bacterium]|nr:DNA-binding response regulator [Pseudomonadota bacterium]